MNHRSFATPLILVMIVIVLLLMQMPVAAQQAKPAAAKPKASAAKPWTVSRTPWGDPDLQGVYTFSTPTPLERPSSLNKDTFTEAELAELEESTAAGFSSEGRAPREGDPGTYNAFWTSTEKGKLTGRTSLIMDPENGRKPPLTERGKKVRDELVKEAAARRVAVGAVQHTLYDTWEDHPTYTRCLARPMPRIGQSYNHGLQILQTPGYVVIDYESLHDVRIIPLDQRPHLDPSIRQWNGDSRGHWEGNTLVVDWTNFTDKQEWQGQPQGNMHFTERITKVDANTIHYEVTVDDPTTWTTPWTFLNPWRANDAVYQSPENLYEYACHEGNYRMMENSLLGTRAIRETLK